MSIERADSQKIDQAERELLLAEFGIDLSSAIATGTEAEVYDLDGDSVLKIYAGGDDRLSYLEILKQMYERVEPSEDIILPRILDVKNREGMVAVVETKLSGEPLEGRIQSLSGEELERAEDLYLTAAHSLSQLRVSGSPERYMLFDSQNVSATSNGTFSEYYANALEKKLETVGEPFSSLIDDFPKKAAKLVEAIREQKLDGLSLVHGDFFPGNVMVDAELTRVTGVIDFGSFTLFGDHSLDLAGAVSYYKMYDEDRQEAQGRLHSKVAALLTEDEQARFHRYILANAIMTSDLYVEEPDPRDNGHFQWAVKMCKEEEHWQRGL